MVNLEFYKPLPAVKVPSNPYFVSECEQVLSGLPLNGALQDSLSLVAIDLSRSPNLKTHASTSLIRPTEDHGRNFELRFGKSYRFLWFDGLNYLTVLNSKGSDLSDPYVLRDRYTPSGFRVNGMQDSNSMRRIVRATSLLRWIEVEAERLLPVLEPLSLPLNDKLVSLEEFKFWLLKDASDQAVKKEEERRGDGEERIRLQDLAKLTKELHQTTFFITLRALHVSERFRDFSLPKRRRDFKKMIGNVFDYLNLVAQVRLDRQEIEYPMFFDPNSQSDLDYYFLNFLPSRAGVNYGRLHRNGLVQKYTHTGNINGIGAIVDTDSIRGERLGDEPIGEEEILTDLKTFLDSSNRVCKLLERRNFIAAEKAFNTFQVNFFRAYIAERLNDQKFTRYGLKIPLSLPNFGYSEYRSAVESSLESEWARLDWGYQYNWDCEGLFNTIYKTYKDYYDLPLDKFRNNLQDGIDPLSIWFVDLGNKIKESLQRTPQWQEIVSSDSGCDLHFLLTIAEVTTLNKTIRDFAAKLSETNQVALGDPQKVWIPEIVTVVAQKLAKECGWDNNILENLPKIWQIHIGFEEIYGHNMEQYYQKMVQQLGWQPTNSYDLEKVLGDFQKGDKRHLENTVRKYLKKYRITNPSRADITKALDEMAEDNEFTRDAYHRLNYFYAGNLSNRFDKKFAKELASLKEKYQPEVAETVVKMFVAREWRKFSEKITPEIKEQIAKEESQRLEAIIEKFVK